MEIQYYNTYNTLMVEENHYIEDIFMDLFQYLYKTKQIKILHILYSSTNTFYRKITTLLSDYNNFLYNMGVSLSELPPAQE